MYISIYVYLHVYALYFSNHYRKIMQQEEERQALIDLYNLCKGEEWYRLENWCSGNGLEAWHGVTTDRTA